MADDFSGGKGGGGGGGFGSGLSFGKGTIDSIGGAVNDLFSAEAFGFKAKGLEIEKGMYTEGAGYADLNAQYTETSTAIKEAQEQRRIEMGLGATEAGVAGSGFENSGSSLDLLRDSASQGALTKQVLGYQGLITEQGYKVQADALRSQASAAGVAEDAAKTAQTGAFIGAAIKGVSAVASVFV